MQTFNIFLLSNSAETISVQLCHSVTPPGRPIATSHTHTTCFWHALMACCAYSCTQMDIDCFYRNIKVSIRLAISYRKLSSPVVVMSSEGVTFILNLVRNGQLVQTLTQAELWTHTATFFPSKSSTFMATSFINNYNRCVIRDVITYF